MRKLMPLKRAVVEVTGEAMDDNPESIRKAIRAWHNRLNSGSIPRHLVAKVGRGLYLDLMEWDSWLSDRREKKARGPGRPRSQ
jgi:hypothetical protein